MKYLISYISHKTIFIAPMNSQRRQTQFWSAIRAAPVFIPMFAAMNLLYHPSQQASNLLLGTGLVHVANQGLKYICRYLYTIPWLEPTLLTLIGPGLRPAGATNSASFLVYPDVPSKTFGMPRRHSQTAF